MHQLPSSNATLRVPRVVDGAVDASLGSERWSDVEPLILRPRGGHGRELATRVWVGWSDLGIWLAFEAEDERFTSTLDEDFAELWTEDVFEAFLWPDVTVPVYFEYEISPRGRELPLMVINHGGRFHGWRPWPDRPEHRVRRSVQVVGPDGPISAPAAGQPISGWSAELFVPFSMLAPLVPEPPVPGARWRANFYRVDHDAGRADVWAWRPTERNFHEPDRFGTLLLAGC